MRALISNAASTAFINTVFLAALKYSARLLEETNSALRWAQQFLLRETGAALTCIWWLSLAFSPGGNFSLDDFRNQFHCLNMILFTAKRPTSPKPRNLIRMLCNHCSSQNSFYLFIKWMVVLLCRICSEVIPKEQHLTVPGAAQLHISKGELLPKNLWLQQVTCALFATWPKPLRPGLYTKARRALLDTDLIKVEQLLHGSIHTLL